MGHSVIAIYLLSVLRLRLLAEVRVNSSHYISEKGKLGLDSDMLLFVVHLKFRIQDIRNMQIFGEEWF